MALNLLVANGFTKEAESDPYTYEEAMNDIDAHHWIKAMKSKLDSTYSNQV